MNSPILDLYKEQSLVEYSSFEEREFLDEVDRYLARYPKTNDIDIFLHDLNGHIRGRRIDINSLKGLAKGCYFPVSVYAMSLDGEVVEASGLGKYIGEPDQMCKPILDSLRPSAYAPTTHAQLFLSMQEDDGSDCMLEPRNILKKILNQLHEQHFFPVMTGELEFYLYPDQQGQNLKQSQCFDLDVFDNNQNVLEEIKKHAELQDIEIISIVAEASSGQYELNIQHTDQILKLADQIMALKRIVKQVAQQYQLQASFMAKPSMHKAGSGLHFHMSLLNQQRQNVFSEMTTDEPAPILLKIIAGLIDLMPASMAILAPNINSFRRFKMGNHVPMEANWGNNNRNVAIRLPCSDLKNKRLEYRVAGADVNPYLALAVILVGVLHGLRAELPLVPACHLMGVNNNVTYLPNNQLDALNLLKNNTVLNEYLGAKFIALWSTCKLFEYQDIHNQITTMELKWGI